MARRGVPARRRRRLLAELRDHLADLTEEGNHMTTDETECAARLGPPERVAAVAAAEYRRAGWVRRHPLLVFGLAPVPALVVGLVVPILVLELAIGAAALVFGVDLDDPPRGVAVAAAFTLNYASRFLPFVLVMAGFTRLYLRSGVRWGWYAAAAGQVLFLAATYMSAVVLRDEPGQSQWMIGFAWLAVLGGQGFLGLIGWTQLAQLAAPLAVGWVMVRVARRRAEPVAV